MSSAPRPKRAPSPRCGTVPPEAGAERLGLPPRDPGGWSAVRDRLVRRRALDPRLVRQCRRHGLLYAAVGRRAVFPCRNATGLLTGAEVVAAAPGAAPRPARGGPDRTRGGFWMADGPGPHPVTLLVESALDALAVCQLHADRLPPGTRLVSTAGPAPRLPAWLRPCPSPLLVCAYGSSARARRARRVLRARLPGLACLLPPRAASWRDALRTAPPRQLPLFCHPAHDGGDA